MTKPGFSSGFTSAFTSSLGREDEKRHAHSIAVTTVQFGFAVLVRREVAAHERQRGFDRGVGSEHGGVECHMERNASLVAHTRDEEILAQSDAVRADGGYRDDAALNEIDSDEHLRITQCDETRP